MLINEQISRIKKLAGIVESESNQNPEIEFPDETSTSTPSSNTEDSNPVDGKVEVDVTTIVNKADENSSKLDDVTQQLQQLKSTMDNITSSLVDMNSIKDKIEQVRNDLTNQIKTSNPTPLQKLQIRGALDTGSYGISVGDYWKGNKPANYQVDMLSQLQMDGSTYDKQGSKEYVITDLDLAHSYDMTDFNIYNSYY